MDISSLETVLKSQEAALEAILNSLSNHTNPEDIRTTIHEHTARTNRIVRNAIPRISSPFKSPVDDSGILFTMTKSTPSKSTPANSVTPSKTMPLKPGFTQSKPLFSRACSTPRKRAMPAYDSDHSRAADSGSPETILEKQWIKNKRPNVPQESRLAIAVALALLQDMSMSSWVQRNNER